MTEQVNQHLFLENETPGVQIDKYANLGGVRGMQGAMLCPVTLQKFPFNIVPGDSEFYVARAAQIAHTRAALKRAARFFK